MIHKFDRLNKCLIIKSTVQLADILPHKSATLGLQPVTQYKLIFMVLPVVNFVDVWSVGCAREEGEELFPGHTMLTSALGAQYQLSQHTVDAGERLNAAQNKTGVSGCGTSGAHPGEAHGEP